MRLRMHTRPGAVSSSPYLNPKRPRYSLACTFTRGTCARIERMRGSRSHQPVTGPISARETKRSEEHTSELQSLMRISYAVFCLNKKKTFQKKIPQPTHLY